MNIIIGGFIFIGVFVLGMMGDDYQNRRRDE